MSDTRGQAIDVVHGTHAGSSCWNDSVDAFQEATTRASLPRTAETRAGAAAASQAELLSGAPVVVTSSPHEDSLESEATLQGRPSTVERSAMMALVAHDLRGPLTALVLTSELIHHHLGELTDDLKSAVEILVDQVRSFHQLVVDLLDISQLDHGLTQLEIQPINLGRFCEQLLRSRHETATVTLAPDAHFVLADPRLLRQIITNLLDNARSYGGGATCIAISRDSEATSIAVEDAGPGLTDDDQRRVFRRFERGSQGSTGHVSGSGLGLSLVAGHVQLHGGEVRYEPLADVGARFVISLPHLHDAAKHVR